MPDYQNNRFKKPSFKRGGADRRDMGPKKLYSAECSNCHERCEVPFRPNGMKPVFCRNCFNRDEERPARDSFRKKEFGAPRESFRPRSTPPQEDRRIDELKRQLTAMEAKLDHLTALLSKAPAAREKKPVEKKAAPKKRIAKK